MLKDDIMAVKKELKEVKEKSIAMELLSDFKRQNQRLYIIWIITFIAFMMLLGYTLWLLNNIGTVEETTVTQENDNGYNNFIGNDGDIINGDTNN